LGLSISKPDRFFLTDLFALGKKVARKKISFSSGVSFLLLIIISTVLPKNANIVIFFIHHGINVKSAKQ
jgi:hypothetical protein